jgi:hypothetical protein
VVKEKGLCVLVRRSLLQISIHRKDILKRIFRGIPQFFFW